MPDREPLRTSRVRGLPMIELIGDVDCYNAPVLTESLVRMIDNGDPDVILNMTHVDFVDSVGLGALVTVHQRAVENGGSLRVLCPNRQIWRVFDITGLMRAFPVYRDELALAASLDAK